MLSIIFLYCLVGGFAGILAGMLGVGGGTVIVPLLIFTFDWQGIPPELAMHMALGTSMGSIMFTSLSSTRSHSKRGGVDWSVLKIITPGILVGTYAGSFVAARIPTRYLQMFFVAFLAYVIYQMLLGKKPKPSRHLPGFAGMSLAGGIIGVISSLVGIGGGSLSVPFMLWNNVEMRKAIGTSAAIGFPIALAGCFGYVVNGSGVANLPPWSLGFLYLPALFGIVAISVLTVPLGVRIAHNLPVDKLKKCFALLLTTVALKMLLNVL